MPRQILPKPAGPFASPEGLVVTGSELIPWLNSLLNTGKSGPPIGATEQRGRLREILSSRNAVWSLAMLTAADFTPMHLPNDRFIDMFGNHVLVRAKIVYVDLRSPGKVFFKLTADTIEDLGSIYEAFATTRQHYRSADVSATEFGHSGREAFDSAVNAFCPQTGASALRNLQSDGSGTLEIGQAQLVKAHLLEVIRPWTKFPPGDSWTTLPSCLQPTNIICAPTQGLAADEAFGANHSLTPMYAASCTLAAETGGAQPLEPSISPLSLIGMSYAVIPAFPSPQPMLFPNTYNESCLNSHWPQQQ